MIRIESVKGVKEMYTSLQSTAGLVPYESKSDTFKEIIKSEKDLLALYENVLLNGSSGDLYTSAIASIKGENAQEKLQKAKAFYEEVKNDVELITKKSHMIRTNEIPRDKLYYNGNTVQNMLGKMSEFMAKPDFYEKLSKENKKLLQDYLKIEEPKLDLSDPEYETKREKYYQEQCEKISKSKLLPFIEKVTTDKDFARYYEMGARLANRQIDPKNLPTEFAEYKSKLSESEVKNFYEMVGFMTGLNVKDEFEPEKIKKDLAVQDSKNIDAADKSAELTNYDIKMIFLNSERFKRPDMNLRPEIVEGQIFPQPSDKKIAAAGLSYEQTISEIKNGLEQIKAGAKYSDINPSVVKYVKFLANNCPSVQFLANINMVEGENCRLAKGNEASKVYEPTGEVEKYLVDSDRFTQDNIEKMINKISEQKDLKGILFDENGKLKVRMDTLARVMNNEVDQRFLTENELVCKMQLEDFYFNLDEKQKEEYITSKEDYIKGNNTLMSVNDLKVLFQCFAENIDKNPQFRMFNISPKDFEVVNGREGKMLKNFGCSYEEFFATLQSMYVDAYNQKAIFASDDKYTTFLRYIMGYCKDMTYAPSVGMNKSANAKENVYPAEEDVNTAVVISTSVNDSTYAKYVLSLPSARNVAPFQSTGMVQEEAKISAEEELTQLMAKETEMKKKIRNLRARIKKLMKEAEGRELSTEESQTKSYLQEKIRQIQTELNNLKARISRLRAEIVSNRVSGEEQNLTEEQIDAIARVLENAEKHDSTATEEDVKKALDDAEKIIEEDGEEEIEEDQKEEEVSDKAIKEQDVEEKEVEEKSEEDTQEKEVEKEEDDEYELDEELELEIKEHLAKTNESSEKMGRLMHMIKDYAEEDIQEKEVEDLEEIVETKSEEVVEKKADEDEILEEIVDEDANVNTAKVVEDEVDLEEIEEEDFDLEEIKEQKTIKKTTQVAKKESEENIEELAMVKQYKA